MIDKYFKHNDYDKYIIERLKEEQNKNNSLYTRISIFIGIISFLFINSQKYLDNPPLSTSSQSIVFYTILILYYICLFLSFIFLMIAVFPRKMGYPPSLFEINNIFKRKKAYYNNIHKPIKDKKIAEIVMKEIRISYIEIVEKNFNVNLKKSKYSYWAIIPLIISIILFITLICLYVPLEKTSMRIKFIKFK